MTKPNVYEYKNLTEYLKDIYKFRKRTETTFSYEKWAEEMGLKSRSYLRALVLGEKVLAAHLLPALLKGLQLNSDETSFVMLLANLHAAPDNQLKALYSREIFKVWTRQIQEVEITDTVEFLSNPLVPQLFTYLSFDDSPSDTKRWARDLNCSDDEIKLALKCLIWQKLVDGNVLENGEIVYRTIAPYFKVPSSQGNVHIRSFHIEGLKQAQVAMLGSPEHRKMYSAFVALTADQFIQVQKLIQDFNEKVVSLCNDKNIHGKRIYRLNQNLIAVSQTVETQSEAEG
ncbi:hypothetical protein CIK05_13460 [Bdellovibrio sp. qaytius]|nr:hypothetical protein CIK05_13460 [Bdellovibrio sp. qaytius]